MSRRISFAIVDAYLLGVFVSRHVIQRYEAYGLVEDHEVRSGF